MKNNKAWYVILFLFALLCNRPEPRETFDKRRREWIQIKKVVEEEHCRAGAAASAHCISEVNTEWLVRRCLKHTVPPVKACSSSVRKEEMRNASERRFKRQSSVIGNDRHTQRIHHSWPFHFFCSFSRFLLPSVYSGQGQGTGKKRTEKHIFLTNQT